MNRKEKIALAFIAACWLVFFTLLFAAGCQAQDSAFLFKPNKDTVRQPIILTKLVKDVYGNWYDTKGVMETELVQPMAKTVNASWEVVSPDSSYKIIYQRVEIVKPKPVPPPVRIYWERSSDSSARVVYKKAPIKKPAYKKKKRPVTVKAPREKTTLRGGTDLYMYISYSLEENGLTYDRAYLNADFMTTKAVVRRVNKTLEVLINNKWYKL